MKIRSHLLYCRQCAQELEDLKAVDSLLDVLEPDQAPPGLFDSIMEAVENTAAGRSGRSNGHAAHRLPGPQPGKSAVAGLLRDLAAAAAVALTAFWLGTGWLAPLGPATETMVSKAVFNYVRYTGAAVSRAQNSMEFINNLDRISLKNFKDREVIE